MIKNQVLQQQTINSEIKAQSASTRETNEDDPPEYSESESGCMDNEGGSHQKQGFTSALFLTPPKLDDESPQKSPSPMIELLSSTEYSDEEKYKFLNQLSQDNETAFQEILIDTGLLKVLNGTPVQPVSCGRFSKKFQSKQSRRMIMGELEQASKPSPPKKG